MDSAEPADDEPRGSGLFRLNKDVMDGAEFQQLAEAHESSEIGDPRRLLQIVGDDEKRLSLSD